MSSAFLYILLPGILVTSFISGIFGMAGGMIMMGIIAWFLPVHTAMVLHGFVQMISNGWRAVLHRQHIQWRIIKFYLPGLLLALAAFMSLQLVVNKAVLFVFLGLMPFLQYLLPKNIAMNIEQPKHAFSAGIVFSSLQLLCGVSGPIVDLYFVKSKLNRHQIIATKAVTQGLGHIMKIFYFGAVVALNEDLPAWLYASAFIAAIAGTSLSSLVLHRMTEQQFRKYSHALIVVIALVYLGRGLSEYFG